MDKKPRIRVELLPYGKVKVTKTTVAKAVERMQNAKRFSVKGNISDFINLAYAGLSGTFKSDSEHTRVVFSVTYTDDRKFPPIVTEPRTLTKYSDTVLLEKDLDGNTIYFVDYQPKDLEDIIADLICRIEPEVNDLRNKIDIFV